MAKVSIIGTGTWGIALGMVLAQNGHEVTAWSALPKEIEALRESYTCKNLPGVEIPRSIVFTADLQEACTDKEMLVLSVPSVFTRGVAKQMNPFVKEGQLIVSVAKGIEEKTLMTMSQQIEDGKCRSSFWPKPCRGSQSRHSDNCCCWSKGQTDS